MIRRRFLIRLGSVAVAIAAMTAIPGTATGELPYRIPGASVRALALGDSVYALGLGTAGLYFNPACMSQINQYSVDAGYGYQSPSKIHNLHVSMVDSQTNPEFAMGAAYSLSKSRRTLNGNDEGLTMHDVRAALSTSVGTEGFQFGFGATFRYLKISGDRLTSPYYLVTNDESKKAGPKSMATFDVGILMTIKDSFFIGASGQNLVTWSRHFAPRLLGVGIGFVYELLDIGAGVEVDFDTRGSIQASPSFGIEYVAGGVVALRAGFNWDRVAEPRQYRVSAGLGYISQYVGVDVGYAHDVMHKENWIIELSIRGFLP